MVKQGLASVAIAAVLLSTAPLRAQSGHEAAFVLALMEAMNPLSVRFNREACGYVLRHPNGAYSSTKVSWGGLASCASLPTDDTMTVVSSWHTHAAYSPDYDGEVPSIQDVEGDMDHGTNGWVATPGGRLWFIDGTSGTMRQFCGPGCLPDDPDFVAQDFGPVAESYTLDALHARFGKIP